MKVINPEAPKKLKNIKAILFDWDGVFHSGYKNHNGESVFSEADSMGMNLIRLGYYLLNNSSIPYTGIITGEQNPTAHFLADREHIDGLFFKFKDKRAILSHLKEIGINKEEVLFVFDDVLDLSLAREVGIRFLIKRTASSNLEDYISNQNYCDFITENDGGNHAVREVCEFILNAVGAFEKTVETRINFGEVYTDYLKKRQAIETQKYTFKNQEIVLV